MLDECALGHMRTRKDTAYTAKNISLDYFSK
jgi:hypothetical protein